MNALVLEDYGRFVYEEADTPIPEKGYVRIRVKACSVCGSDVHGMDGSTGRRRPPVIMGHEAAGEIDALGEGVTGYAVGDRVTFDSTIYCGVCEMCKKGLINLCKNRRVLGVSCAEYRMNGAFADYVCVPAYVLYRLPDTVSFVQASLVEPMSVAYHAILQAPLPDAASEEAAMVVGCGTIGMLAIMILHGLGVKNIIAVDIDARRLAMANAAGARSAIRSGTPDTLPQILKAAGGLGPVVSYDMTGIEATLLACIEATAENGHIVMVGNVAPTVAFPLQKAILKQLKLHGSCASAGEYDRCLALIAEGKVDVEKIVSACVPLSEGDAWIHKVYNREDGMDKIVLIP